MSESRGAGRPTKIDERLILEIVDFIHKTANIYTSFLKAGVARSTFFLWKQQYESGRCSKEVRKLFDESYYALSDMEAFVESLLLTSMAQKDKKGEIVSVDYRPVLAWLERCHGYGDFRRKDQVALAPPDADTSAASIRVKWFRDAGGKKKKSTSNMELSNRSSNSMN